MSLLSSILAALGLALTPSKAPPPPPAAGPMSEATRWVAEAQSPIPPNAEQVRIEQRIIWRIGPMTGPSRDNLMSLAPTDPGSLKLKERKADKCVPMGIIAGGQAQGGSRLLLFLRDRRLLAADLERACSARDFYSGFYVDKPDADGKLCAGRDRILSRSGARCSIAGFRLLVAEG